ncbi:YCF48-related protein [Epilithonimonas sp.]|uniref:T9SS type A sorting domain-containing protein n=1 Tax=Epilithonimonas sp. TaxID=2894511 RepID=UPI0028A0F5B8|nr:YCF48-related protein [Epilithonimonas sp.]
MKTILTLFAFWFFNFNCSAQWIEQNVGNITASNFIDVYAITPDNVIVVGNNGTILKTTDGGTTWQQKNSGTTQDLGKIQFPTSNIGYIIEASGKLLKTNDGGETWSSITLDNISSIYSLSCVNENLIFLSCIDSNSKTVLLKSNDGGNSWEKVNGNDAQAKFYDIQFFNEEIGYATSSYTPYTYLNKILKTQDGGKNWVEIIEPYYSPFNFINKDIGFYYTNGFYKTADGGNNFVRLGYGSIHNIKSIFSINENTVWGIFEEQTMCGCGPRGLVRMTYSPENGYQEYQQNHNAYISSIYFSNVKVGYAVGMEDSKAKIWKNVQADLTLDAKEDELKNSIRIYPNPASDKITISLSSPLSREFFVILVDMTGKVVYSQNVNNINKTTIDVRCFSKGNYILTIQNQKQSHSQKIVIK